jgi:hypothetical protein
MTTLPAQKGGVGLSGAPQRLAPGHLQVSERRLHLIQRHGGRLLELLEQLDQLVLQPLLLGVNTEQQSSVGGRTHGGWLGAEEGAVAQAAWAKGFGARALRLERHTATFHAGWGPVATGGSSRERQQPMVSCELVCVCPPAI